MEMMRAAYDLWQARLRDHGQAGMVLVQTMPTSADLDAWAAWIVQLLAWRAGIDPPLAPFLYSPILVSSNT